MNERPNLCIKLDSKTFKEYYYLKEELIEFCRKNNLQTTGGKIELTERIAKFLNTGERNIENHSIKRAKIVNVFIPTKKQLTIKLCILQKIYFMKPKRRTFKSPKN